MRILFITNFYPPHELGGQGQSCQQVVEGLQMRGHETIVLTTTHGVEQPTIEQGNIYRQLYLEMELLPWRHSITFFTHRKRREAHNLTVLKQITQQLQPDVLFIWGMWNVPRSVPALAELLYSPKILYRFADYWPTLPSQHEFYWQTGSHRWYVQLPKRLLGQVALWMLSREEQPSLKFPHAMCVSDATRQALLDEGISPADVRVIHSGIDAKTYLDPESSAGVSDSVVRLLYAGRLSKEKGVHTALEAFAKLKTEYHLPNISLSIVGSGDPQYLGRLRQIAKETGTIQSVSFIGQVPPSEMPAWLHRHHILVFPSIWVEPFSRVILEAMASGLAVVATANGGQVEVIDDSHNGKLFTADDPEDLAATLVPLITDLDLRRCLAETGRRTVLEKFTIDRMLENIEAYLTAVIEKET